MGFHRGAVCVEFRALAAWGKKLLSSLVERALMLPVPSSFTFGPSRYYWLYWSIVQGKYPGWRGEGHWWFLQRCSLSAGGSCSSRTDSDAAGQHTLNGSPVEGGEDGWRETCSFQPAEKCRRCCAFLEIDMVLVVQVRSSVMCTPRNLVLLTLSTVELSMVSGGWSTEFLLSPSQPPLSTHI